MNNKSWASRALLTFILLPNLLLSTTVAGAQDLVPTGSLGGGSSVFVFRATSRQVVRRIAPQAKPVRTVAQRLDTVRKIKTQYQTIAQVVRQPNRAPVVEPGKLNPSLPPVQASKLFAGVGEYYLSKNDHEKSFEFFEEAIKLDPANTDAKNGYAEALATRGTDLLEKEKVNDAKLAFQEALRNNPNNIAANFGLGEVYAELDQQADAIKSYEKAISLGKDLTEIYVPLGILYYQTGEIAKADDMLTKAIAANANSAETQYFLGLVRMSQNRLDEALAAFNKAKTLDPDYADAYYNAAEVLVKQKKPVDAIKDYETAVKLRPNNFDAQLGLGQSYLEAGKYAEAIPVFNAAKRLKNNSWEVYAGLGEAQRQTGDYVNAYANLRQAGGFYVREKDFDKETAADIYSKAGFVLGQQCPIDLAKGFGCRWPEAIESLETAVQLANNPLDQANLGWAYYNDARTDLDRKDKVAAAPKLASAKAALEKALAANNQVVVDGAKQNLGAVLLDMGDPAGAVNALKDIVDRHPDWVFSRYALATGYFLTNDFNNAAKWFNDVISKDPKHLAAMLSLGQTYIKLKNGKELKRVIDMVRPLAPNDAIGLEATAKVAKIKLG